MKLLLLLLAIFVGVALSFDGTYFQLDGDAYTQGCGEDWDKLYQGSGLAKSFSGIVSDTTNPTTFSGSNSKNTKLISQWRWSNRTVADTKDLQHVFVAYYSLSQPDGQSYLYFGTDRYATNKNTPISFWFFQEDVHLNGNGTFSGARRNGDLLVTTSFDSAPTLSIYKWLNGSLVVVDSSTFGICQTGATQMACVRPNGFPVPSPWPFTPSNGTANVFQQYGFLEGAINLEQVYAGDSVRPCFNTFLVATMGTKQVDSALKDFILSHVSTCSLRVDVECLQVNAGTQSNLIYDYDFRLTNDGFGQLYSLAIDYNGSTLATSPTLAAQQSFVFNVTTITKSGSILVDPLDGSGFTVYSPLVDFYKIYDTDAKTCYAPSLTTSMAFDYQCDSATIDDVDEVMIFHYGGTLTDTGFGDITLTHVFAGQGSSPPDRLDLIGQTITSYPPTNIMPFEGTFTDTQVSWMSVTAQGTDYRDEVVYSNWLFANCPAPVFTSGLTIEGTCQKTSTGWIDYNVNATITVCNTGTIKLKNIMVRVYYGNPFEVNVPNINAGECLAFNPTGRAPFNVQIMSMNANGPTMFNLNYVNAANTVPCILV